MIPLPADLFYVEQSALGKWSSHRNTSISLIDEYLAKNPLPSPARYRRVGDLSHTMLAQVWIGELETEALMFHVEHRVSLILTSNMFHMEHPVEVEGR